MLGFWDGSGISWIICKQSACRSRQITTPTPHHSTFTDRMLFLTPNCAKALKATLGDELNKPIISIQTLISEYLVDCRLVDEQHPFLICNGGVSKVATNSVISG